MRDRVGSAKRASKKAMTDRNRRIREADPVAFRARTKQYHIKRTYGIRPETYQAMVAVNGD
jgi:hypothetical protein